MWRVLAAIVACLLWTTAAGAESLGKLEKGKFVTQAMIEEGENTTFKVAEIGVFRVLKIDPGKAGGNCHVSLPSLQEEIARGHERGTLAFEPRTSLKTTMKTGECTDPAGNTVVCCRGAGSTCSVTVETQSLY